MGGSTSFAAMVMFQMSDAHYETIYNVLSFSLASMMSTTLFLWLRMPAIVPKYKSAVLISGMVTFIAAYHYIRIFNSWVDAYEYPKANAGAEYPGFSAQAYPDPVLTGVPFNDAYRYMDWLLTVPLLLIEIVLVMKLSPEETNKESQDAQPECVRDQVKWACWATVISWCTYPIVYVLPMLSGSTTGKAGLSASSMVAVQVGYTVSDVISKCGVGFLVYNIALSKSMMERGELEEDCVKADV